MFATGAELLGQIAESSVVLAHFSLVFAAIATMANKATVLQHNKKNCILLAQRANTLEPILLQIRQHWLEVESSPSAQEQDALTASRPIFTRAVGEFGLAQRLVEKASEMSGMARWLKSSSVQNRPPNFFGLSGTFRTKLESSNSSRQHARACI